MVKIDRFIREWSLLMGSGGGGGGLQNGRGWVGKRSFTLAEKVLAMLKGGTTGFEVVLTWELEVLAILMEGGGMQKVSTL